MKLHWKAPKKEVLIVRPDNKGNDYEFWILVPTKIGEAHRRGHKRIECNGNLHTNLRSVVGDLLRTAKEFTLAEELEPKSLEVTGLDLVEKEVWKKFCERRKLDVRSMKEMQRRFTLTPAEAQEFGLDTEM